MDIDKRPLYERVIFRVTSPPLLTAFFVMVAAGSLYIGLRYLLGLEGPTNDDGEIITGDFLAFWTGARLVWEGQGAQLYDMDVQHALQRSVLDSGRTDWQPYINPPLLALALSPLGALDIIPALRCFAFISTAALCGALFLLRSAIPDLLTDRRAHLTAALVVACFPPMVRMAAGAQNAALTLLLLVGTFVALRRERFVVAGILVGLLTFKPQFGTLLALMLLVQCRWRVLVVASVVTGLHLAAATFVLGPDWMTAVYEALTEHLPRERTDNPHTHFALLPALQYALGASGRWLAIAAMPVVALCVAWSARRARPGLAFGAAITGSMLISPHLQYYDVVVLSFPVLLALDSMARHGPIGWPTRLALALVWEFDEAADWSENLGFQPLLLGLVAVFVWLLVEMRRDIPDRLQAPRDPPSADSA